MRFTHHADADSLLAVARETLLAQEAVNGLILGICSRLAAGGAYSDAPPFLGTVESGRGLELVAVMTPPHKLLLHTPDQVEDASLALLADHLLSTGVPVPGVSAPEGPARRFAEVWCARTGATARLGMRLCIYELRQVQPLPLPRGEFRLAGEGDLEIVRGWSRGFHTACFGNDESAKAVQAGENMIVAGDLFLWVDDVPVSMAARTRRTLHGQAVSHVYTPPQHRRHGYATAVVAGLSQRMLDDGREFCTLYTDLSNPTSNGIYQQIGYRPIADVVDLLFDSP